MKKTIATMFMAVTFISLFFVPSSDSLSWSFILDKSIQVALFILSGRFYDRVTARQ